MHSHLQEIVSSLSNDAEYTFGRPKLYLAPRELACRSPRALVQAITTTIRPPVALLFVGSIYPRHSERRPL
jgi:hypothetical protein